MSEDEDLQAALSQWLTSPSIAAEFWKWCHVKDDDVVLEPAAGEGALIPVGRANVLAFELDPERVQELQYWRPEITIVCRDFLAVPPPAVFAADVSVQNPPYHDCGEGLFVERSLHWAPRVCALVRNGSLHGTARFDACWSKVQLTRVSPFKHRPKFLGPYGTVTKFTPAYDYMAIEAVMRKNGEVDRPEVTWVDWR